jgi:hypothetical protein
MTLDTYAHVLLEPTELDYAALIVWPQFHSADVSYEVQLLTKFNIRTSQTIPNAAAAAIPPATQANQFGPSELRGEMSETARAPTNRALAMEAMTRVAVKSEQVSSFAMRKARTAPSAKAIANAHRVTFAA